MAAGDPERLVEQMAGRRDHCLREVGTDPATEAFSTDVAQFLTDWVKPKRSYFDRFPSVTDYEDRNRKCEHCGYTEAALDDALLQHQLAGVSPAPGEWPGGTAPSWPSMRPDVAHPPSPRPAAVLTALAWFPPDQWAQALTRWPTLAEDNNSKHAVYCQELDAHLRRIQDAAPPASHLALAVAPIRIEHYLDWCESEGEDPAARAARASYAANQARLGDIIDWPPAGRQHSCWCGSGRKYKRCCAPRD